MPELLSQSRLFVFLLWEQSVHSLIQMCQMAKHLCERGSWQRETPCYVTVPEEFTCKKKTLGKREKKSPCCKLVSLSACNFLHCLFCCALKISYLVLPRGCIIVNSLLSHSRLSISLSLSLSLHVQCKCLSSSCGNKASWQLSRSGSACYCFSCHSGKGWHLEPLTCFLSVSDSFFKPLLDLGLAFVRIIFFCRIWLLMAKTWNQNSTND